MSLLTTFSLTKWTDGIFCTDTRLSIHLHLCSEFKRLVRKPGLFSQALSYVFIKLRHKSLQMYNGLRSMPTSLFWMWYPRAHPQKTVEFVDYIITSCGHRSNASHLSPLLVNSENWLCSDSESNWQPFVFPQGCCVWLRQRRAYSQRLRSEQWYYTGCWTDYAFKTTTNC